MQYLNIPPPVRLVHFLIYPVPTRVVFTVWHLNEVISAGDLVQEISDLS